MKSLNKSLLAAAVIGAIALPGLSSAAILQYSGAKQIVYAQDLIVNDDVTIHTPNNLRLSGESTDAANIMTITGPEDVTVKMTLTNGARFDSTSNAIDFVAGFIEGQQTGGNGTKRLGATPSQIVGNPSYSGNGQELNFVYTTTAAGVLGGVNDFFLELNSAVVRNLVQSLGSGGEIAAEITVQNKSGQVILAANRVIAQATWGLTINQTNNNTYFPDAAKRIDVASTPQRKTLFSPNGNVGGSATATNGAEFLFIPGRFDLDVTKVAEVNAPGSLSYINNFNAVVSPPHYNIISTSVFTVQINGTNLSAFAGGRAWLDSQSTCNSTGVNIREFEITEATPDIATTTIPVTHALVNNLMKASPDAAPLYVCLAAGRGTTASPYRELIPQDLSGTVSVAYNFDTQRVAPPPVPFDLSPLQLNGATVYFQNVNPAGNTTAESFLRLTNHNARECPFVIDAKDDAGRLSGEVRLDVPAHASEQININVLESGIDPRFTNANAGLRNGTGKWYVRVTAECNHITASALNRNSNTGVVTDLTPQDNSQGNDWSTPTILVP